MPPLIIRNCCADAAAARDSPRFSVFFEDAMSANDSTTTHDEVHTGPIKTPKQLLMAVFYSFVVPILAIIGLVLYVTSGNKPASGTDDTEKAVTQRIQKIGMVALGDASSAPPSAEPAATASAPATNAATPAAPAATPAAPAKVAAAGAGAGSSHLGRGGRGGGRCGWSRRVGSRCGSRCRRFGRWGGAAGVA